ncbi:MULTISPECIES: hypothetical protein [unclassified Oceanobacter]|uniref:hypothetical protein n=1 Tax=unclassified Oceanobacter TaxID=2620260 RepID=UPI002736BCBE|nr:MULTISPECIES: hypothetical protein [unclassified Oceanobacter]MDP2505580.1 hypothetical protein [Oceanobacter sp. 3_MG-2023]MDP2547162.1 hypothetical protein [Oceanobacter sp. 4_MG-2023]
MFTQTQCLSKRTGNPLVSYLTQEEAVIAAQYALQTYQNAMVPYLCDRCTHWHLCPEERHTPSETCNYCTSSDGKPKQLYATYEGAKKRAECLWHEKGQRLYVYECPHQHGWHLTKSGSF